LSAREVEVLRLIAGGNPNKLVADPRSISEETVFDVDTAGAFAINKMRVYTAP
jgi:FixJ family two-component response regulator